MSGVKIKNTLSFLHYKRIFMGMNEEELRLMLDHFIKYKGIFLDQYLRVNSIIDSAELPDEIKTEYLIQSQAETKVLLDTEHRRYYSI